MSRGTRFRRDLADAAYVVMIVIVVLILFVSPLMLRWHGIWSCEDRGGRPIANNIFSEQMWDVSCLEP